MITKSIKTGLLATGSALALVPSAFAQTTGGVGTFNPATAVSGVDFTGVGAAITAGAGVMLGISALWLAYSFVKRAVRRAA